MSPSVPDVARGVALAVRPSSSSCPHPRRPRSPRGRARRAAAPARASSRPPSSVNGTSGTRQKFTCPSTEHRIGGDEPRVAAHQLHEPDAVARALGLGVGGVDRAARLATAVSKPNVFCDERDVVVDRLGHADDARSAPLAAPPPRRSRCAPRSVPSPPIANSMSMPRSLQRVDHRAGSLLPAREAEDACRPRVDAAHLVGPRRTAAASCRARGPRSRSGSRASPSTPYCGGARAPSPRITLLMPGHSPPQVTIAARVVGRIEEDAPARGPAFSRRARRPARLAAPSCSTRCATRARDRARSRRSGRRADVESASGEGKRRSPRDRTSRSACVSMPDLVHPIRAPMTTGARQGGAKKRETARKFH